MQDKIIGTISIRAYYLTQEKTLKKAVERNLLLIFLNIEVQFFVLGKLKHLCSKPKYLNT